MIRYCRYLIIFLPMMMDAAPLRQKISPALASHQQDKPAIAWMSRVWIICGIDFLILGGSDDRNRGGVLSWYVRWNDVSLV